MCEGILKTYYLRYNENRHKGERCPGKDTPDRYSGHRHHRREHPVDKRRANKLPRPRAKTRKKCHRLSNVPLHCVSWSRRQYSSKTKTSSKAHGIDKVPVLLLERKRLRLELGNPLYFATLLLCGFRLLFPCSDHKRFLLTTVYRIFLWCGQCAKSVKKFPVGLFW